MPLFEVETENHILITWAENGDAASAVVSDAYPQESVMRLTKRPRDTWVISKSALGISGKMDPLPHGPRLPVEGRRGQGPRHSSLHARNGRRPRTGPQSDRIEHGDGLVAMPRSAMQFNVMTCDVRGMFGSPDGMADRAATGKHATFQIKFDTALVRSQTRVPSRTRARAGIRWQRPVPLAFAEQPCRRPRGHFHMVARRAARVVRRAAWAILSGRRS